ncbi:hypothetical protein CH063_09399 [Colletotrichum higginsianum]|uniref:Myb-like domain-containing protein n=1 Tax=Colletotrichum higginsianum (strain IMI 349063) TaxID=759273 RepID=H1VDF8_COLHI|nr:hypothetical protein CH63R_04378 [Colletotrichum higginsianum IMI 349063]OBR12082.1 hypothetical protein CH63R_04378 [Colletotrichum higginsianum IMI 349063]CCF38261.1 hypothetical protein CH063_09399 [Colletotrichum higginsianum]
MKNSKKNKSKHLQDPAAGTWNDDGNFSTTTVTVQSDDNVSDTMTLVDVFPDMAVGDLFESDDNTTSVETSVTPSSEVSTNKQSTPGAEASNNELDLKTSHEKGRNSRHRKKAEVADDVESEPGISADTSSAEISTISEELTSSEAGSAEIAMAQSTTSGETASNEASTSGDKSTKSGGASSSAQSSNAGNWTPSEDALIISMKNGGESWASIGNAINRGKNEVKKRWHVAKVNAANSESGGDSQTESGGDVSQSDSVDETQSDQSQEGQKANEKFKSKAERKAARKADQKKNKGKSMADDTTKEAGDCAPKPKGHGQKTKKHKGVESSEAPTTPKTTPSFNSIGDSPNSSLRNRLTLLRDTTSASSSTSSATSNDGEYGDGPPNQCYTRELARQERYIRRHVNPTLYPPPPPPLSSLMLPPKTANPPSHLDKRQRRDDKILASLMSQREATKWLEMQANFYNVTGRMVPLHMIKTRCDAEEDRGKAAGIQYWAASVAHDKEMLDPNEGTDAPEDALVDSDEDDEE